MVSIVIWNPLLYAPFVCALGNSILVTVMKYGDFWESEHMISGPCVTFPISYKIKNENEGDK